MELWDNDDAGWTVVDRSRKRKAGGEANRVPETSHWAAVVAWSKAKRQATHCLVEGTTLAGIDMPRHPMEALERDSEVSPLTVDATPTDVVVVYKHSYRGDAPPHVPGHVWVTRDQLSSLRGLSGALRAMVRAYAGVPVVWRAFMKGGC